MFLWKHRFLLLHIIQQVIKNKSGKLSLISCWNNTIHKFSKPVYRLKMSCTLGYTISHTAWLNLHLKITCTDDSQYIIQLDSSGPEISQRWDYIVDQPLREQMSKLVEKWRQSFKDFAYCQDRKLISTNMSCSWVLISQSGKRDGSMVFSRWNALTNHQSI